MIGEKTVTYAGRIGLGLVVVGAFVYLIDASLWLQAAIIGGAGVLGFGTSVYYFRRKIGEVLSFRGTRFGANVAAMTVLLLGVLAIVNFISYRHYWRYDVTKAKSYTLSDETLKVIKNLRDSVRITAFYVEGSQEAFKDLLKGYTYHSPKISFRFVDPDKNPELTEQYGIASIWKQGTPGVAVLESGKREVKITENTEDALTNALIKVTRAGTKVVCVLEGHAEKDMSDSQTVYGYDLAKKALEDQNLTVRNLFLATVGGVPTDCALLMIAGPKRGFVGREQETISSYLDAGGNALIMLDPNVETGYETILGRWGVDIGRDVIIEPVLRIFAGPSLGLEPVVESYGDHPITKDFKGNTLFSIARSVRPRTPAPGGITVTTLASTSKDSWAETDLAGVFQKGTARFEAGDTRGPVPIAAAVTGSHAGKKAVRIVVIGDSDFVSNKFITALFNRDFFLNCVNWLVEEENLISIRPKEKAANYLFLSQGQADFVFYFGVVLLPGAIVIVGLRMWWKRRTL